ncbi:MFS transporter [Micromonospora wenchangensis]|uniref:MFS transporter n=1 Tax=Micromonospora wenchangensis TaxID=1185415 RepID=UPI003813E08E
MDGRDQTSVTTKSQFHQRSRDGITWCLYLNLSVFGYVLYGFGPSISLLARDLSLSDTAVSLHAVALAVGAVVAGLTAAALVDRLGRSVTQTSSLVALGCGVVGYCAGDTFAMTLTSAVLIGYAGNLIVNTTSAGLSVHHGRAAAARISEANGISAGVGMVAPVALGAAATLGWGWRAGLLLAMPMLVTAIVVSRRLRLPASPRALANSGPYRLGGPFWIAWLIFVACALVEMCMVFWASEQLRRHAGMEQGVATMAISLMLGGIVVGRVVGAVLVRHRKLENVLVASIAVHLAGFALFWLSTTPAVAVAGLVICGLGMALQIPLAMTRAMNLSEGRSDVAMARLGVGTGVATAVGPFLLSVLGDVVGIHLAFLLVPILLVWAIMLTAIRRSRSRLDMLAGH